MATPNASDRKLLTTMRHRYDVSASATNKSRVNQKSDLKFFGGSPDNQWQWPDEVLKTRGSVQGQTINARPCLTINKLPQHTHQVTNDQRQNRMAGKVIPVDDKATVEAAEFFDGMVRHIEYMSDIDVVFDTACENQVVHGEGYVRIITEYLDDDSFDQEIRYKRIRDPFSVYMDPNIQDPCGMDQEYCLLETVIPTEEYEREYPDAMTTSSFDAQGISNAESPQWINENTVRIVEYFYYEYKKHTLNQWPGNITTRSGTKKDNDCKAMFTTPLKSRVVNAKVVKWVKSNGFEILESQDWAGKWIPVVRVVGNEIFVDGEVHVSGLVRNAKDAQRMYNYWVSQEAEILALAPKAPFVGYGGQFEGYEDKWKTANVNNWPYLEVNPDVQDGQGSPLPLPQRSPPPMAPTGVIQAKAGASDDIKSTTGQYDSSLGATSNERTGKAILARERQGDIGTFHYIDNLNRARRACTRILVDLIPKIYDTARMVRIIKPDNEIEMAHVNPDQEQAVNKDVNELGEVLKTVYNPGVGKYDVMITTGPDYMTKRQESLEAMSTILQSNPQLWGVAGDLFIKNMDWPGAQEMAERFEKTMDPKILAADDKSPALRAAEQVIQNLTQEVQQMQSMIQNIDHTMEAQKLQMEEASVMVKAYDAETKRLAALSGAITPDQMQEIVLGTIHGMIASGDLQKHLSSPTTEVPQGNPDGSGQPQPAPPAGGPASLFEHRAALQSSKIAPA